MKKGKSPARKAKPVTAKKPVAKSKKPAGGLLNKLKGALSGKAKPSAKKAAVAKKAPAKQAAAKLAKTAVAKKAVALKKKPAAKPAAKSQPKARPLPSKKPTPKTVLKKSSVAVPKSTAKPAPAKSAAKSKAPVAKAKAVAPVAEAAAAAVAKPVRRKLPADGSITEDYIRSMKESEYMNDVQMSFFRRRLIQMRDEVLQREVDVKERLHEREIFADPADRATAEEEHWLDLRLRERESLLLKKIDDTLRRIESKEYGYCEKTGDPIGIPRLLARPTATVCVDIKGQDERFEAQFRDR